MCVCVCVCVCVGPSFLSGVVPLGAGQCMRSQLSFLLISQQVAAGSSHAAEMEQEKPQRCSVQQKMVNRCGKNF